MSTSQETLVQLVALVELGREQEFVAGYELRVASYTTVKCHRFSYAGWNFDAGRGDEEEWTGHLP